ncbi:MAG: thioredoxin-like domain-containing protein [Pyrinomonadaceae bacterium]
MQTVTFPIEQRRARRGCFLGVRLGALLSIVVLVLGPPGSKSVAGLMCHADVQGQVSDGDYDVQYQKGLDLLRRHKYEEALKSFKRANEMRDKKSAECFLGMARAYQGLEAHKNVVESCDKVLEFAGNDTGLRLPAYNLKGLAFQSQAEGKNQKKLQEAEAVFRQGLAVDGALPIFHYNLGFVLMRDLHKRYAKEPSFVMIGISSDTEEETWRDFTAKNKMVWPQYWDRDRRVQRAFRVGVFPTYIVIDHEGIVRFRTSGTSWERSAYLDDAIRKHVKIVAKTSEAN